MLFSPIEFIALAKTGVPKDFERRCPAFDLPLKKKLHQNKSLFFKSNYFSLPFMFCLFSTELFGLLVLNDNRPGPFLTRSLCSLVLV